jgi:hypothetical protein
MAFHRRFPLHVRPLPFVAGWVLLVLGIGYGFSWVWDTSVFSGSLLIQTKIPTKLVVFQGLKILWLLAAAAGAVLLTFVAYGSRRHASRGGLWAPTWRFFPLTALFGAFLVFFGAYWLFDLRFSFDEVGGVFVMFTSLNYANVLSRPFIGTIGGLLMGAGFVALVAGGVDFRIPRAKPTTRPAQSPEPAAAAPAASRPIARQPEATKDEAPTWLEDTPPASTPKPSASAKPAAGAKKKRLVGGATKTAPKVKQASAGTRKRPTAAAKRKTAAKGAASGS